MKTLLQWIALGATSLALTLLPVRVVAQTTPTLQGTFVSDPAVPAIISPSVQGLEYFVLNQDLSLLTHSSVNGALNGTCAAPSGFSATSTTPRTFVNDTSSPYFTAQSSANSNVAASAFTGTGGTCRSAPALTLTGGVPTYSLSVINPNQTLLYVVNGFNGNGPDTLTVFGARFGSLVLSNSVNLDTGAQYTSVVSDERGGGQLTAITELKTTTSPGNLWIYASNTQKAYKVLGPGGVPLPAVSSFIIPAQTDGAGELLVLVNQDGLTAANLSSPPQDTTPFTIIDLGQLLQINNPYGNTITLPFVTQIKASASFYAMLGAAYNPLTRLVYAVVGGGSLTGVTASVISYDPFNPASPSETVVGDVSSIPVGFGSYPQLALNAAGGTLQILTGNPVGLYSVGITGTGNTAVPVTGALFPDSNFKPTFITANPLSGETYIASASGQVDVLTTAKAGPRATLTLNGDDITVPNGVYPVRALALSPANDAALNAATVTITATPKGGGSSFTFTTAPYQSLSYPGTRMNGQFAAAGIYTLVGSVPATANYPAFTSNPINVTVSSSTSPGVFPTVLALSVPATNLTKYITAAVSLAGSTYAPTGRISITDETGTQVGSYAFSGAVLSLPISISVTLAKSPSTLTATYTGDAQNATSTSAPSIVNVGTATPTTLNISAPANVFTGASLITTVTLKATGSPTAAITGNVTLMATGYGGTVNSYSLGTMPATAALASGGVQFTGTIPAAGTYTLAAVYPGDANYATSSGSVLITVAAATTTTAVSAASSSPPLVAFPVNIRLTAQAGTTAVPTGNVVITSTAASTGATITIGTITAAQALVAGGYQATKIYSILDSYTITATYAGDANFSGSTASVVVVVANAAAAPTTLGISAPSNITAGSNFISTLTLKATGSPTAAITGNVTLMATGYGGTVNSYSLGTVPASSALASGGVQVTASIPAAGTYSLAAVYPGDANYSTSSGSVVVTVGAYQPSFSMALPQQVVPPVVVHLHGAFAPTTTLTLTAVGGFNTPLALTALPVKYKSGLTFTFLDASGNPITSVTPSATGTVVTIEVSGSLYLAQDRREDRSTRFPTSLAGGLVCLMLCGVRGRTAQMRKGLTLFGMILLVGICGAIIAGCAPDGSPQPVNVTATPVNNSQGAPPQTVTFYVD